MQNGSWVDHELTNWARWCNSGMMPGPSLGIDPTCLYDEDSKPPLVHIENAKKVQGVFDVSVRIERKILQAEYLSPAQYARYSNGIGAAARRLKLSVPAYETILASVKRRVERAFS